MASRSMLSTPHSRRSSQPEKSSTTVIPVRRHSFVLSNSPLVEPVGQGYHPSCEGMVVDRLHSATSDARLGEPRHDIRADPWEEAKRAAWARWARRLSAWSSRPRTLVPRSSAHEARTRKQLASEYALACDDCSAGESCSSVEGCWARTGAARQRRSRCVRAAPVQGMGSAPISPVRRLHSASRGVRTALGQLRPSGARVAKEHRDGSAAAQAILGQQRPCGVRAALERRPDGRAAPEGSPGTSQGSGSSAGARVAREWRAPPSGARGVRAALERFPGARAEPERRPSGVWAPLKGAVLRPMPSAARVPNCTALRRNNLQQPRRYVFRFWEIALHRGLDVSTCGLA